MFSFMPTPPGVPIWIVMDSQRSLALAASAPMTVTRDMTPPWLAWLGMKSPDTSLVSSAGAAVAFFIALGFGLLWTPLATNCRRRSPTGKWSLI